VRVVEVSAPLPEAPFVVCFFPLVVVVVVVALDDDSFLSLVVASEISSTSSSSSSSSSSLLPTHPHASVMRGGICTHIVGSTNPFTPSAANALHGPLTSPNVIMASLSFLFVDFSREFYMHFIKVGMIVPRKKEYRTRLCEKNTIEW
jgi:hypothetical protein